MYVEALQDMFAKHRNEEQAVRMGKYMKNHFPFLGIKTPERQAILREFFNESSILKEEELPLVFLKSVWALPEREYHYAVLSMLTRRPRWLQEEHVPWIEELIVTKSWWDSVDTIATHIVGELFTREPQLIQEYVPKWEQHDNLWLRRTAILFQLSYKSRTDEELLGRVIRLNADHQDFFIRKAIGWALREYSKTDPMYVEGFIQEETLSNLSIREGLKHINREKEKLMK